MESLLNIEVSGTRGELDSTAFLAYSKQETKHIQVSQQTNVRVTRAVINK
jgi:hypothetical protein